MDKENSESITIDGSNMILGRTSTSAAKQLLSGKKINIINAEKMIITGDPQTTVSKYVWRRQTGSAHHGPYYPIRPDMIVKRTVRSMLPYKTNKGRAALRKLRVHIGTPKNIKPNSDLKPKQIKTRFITVEKLSKSLGWKPKADL